MTKLDMPELLPGRDVLILGRDDVQRLASVRDLIPLMTEALKAISAQKVIMPLRRIMSFPSGGALGTMPGYLSDPPCFGIKVTAVFPDNFGSPYQSHQGIIVLFETRNGCPKAFIHGGEVTARRTAAASAAATDRLARKDADDLAILGYGEQAEMHLEAMAAVRPIRRVRVWGRSLSRALKFSAAATERHRIPVQAVWTAEEAVKDADIVCTVTASPEPILMGDWVAPGTHLNVVGSSVADTGEIDAQAVRLARIYVDYEESAAKQAGEILAAQREGVVDSGIIFGEVGEVILGSKPGRERADQITMFKSLGMSVEDLMSSLYLYRRAQEEGVGIWTRF